MIAECLRHERECGACSENGRLSRRASSLIRPSKHYIGLRRYGAGIPGSASRRMRSTYPAGLSATGVAPPSSVMNSRCLVCRERSIVRGDEGRIMTRPSSRPEARRRLGCQTANELGAPVASSIPHSCQGTSPHQQGWDTKMAMLFFCGVDVSKDRLDMVVLSEGWFFSVSNDTAGWAELVARL